MRFYVNNQTYDTLADYFQDKPRVGDCIYPSSPSGWREELERYAVYCVHNQKGYILILALKSIQTEMS